MWIVVHLAKTLEAAQALEQKLQGEGILVKLCAIYKNKSAQDNYYEILVLKSESEEAREIILGSGL